MTFLSGEVPVLICANISTGQKANTLTIVIIHTGTQTHTHTPRWTYKSNWWLTDQPMDKHKAAVDR